MRKTDKQFDVVVVGGGMSGICAAVASARHGAKTALIQNRPVLGGNASSEIRMHICGADHHASRANARETGLIEEFELENKRQNPTYSWAIWDSVLWGKCAFQENLTLFLNTHMTDVEMQNGLIKSVTAYELTSETTYKISGKIFIEATGDGTLAALAGAEVMYGREDKTKFGEEHGQDVPDQYTMGNSIMFQARDMGQPVPFIKPDWANTYTEEDLKLRDHSDPSSGYWWIELGGGKMHTIDDAEPLRDELLKVVYGVWDHIKNGGDHGAGNYALEWVGMLPGKRESRRIVGDYVLREKDLINNTHFEDAVAYGGWAMDCHVVEGFLSQSDEPTTYLHMDDVYEIPYRTMCSKDVDNLMLAGRSVSTSHMAFGSTRVMATCAVMGQAAGTAAAMAVESGDLPKSIYGRMDELQQTLLRDDCYIPNVKNTDQADKARSAKISATSQKAGFEAENVISGVSRTVGNCSNMYCSEGIGEDGETVTLELSEPSEVSSVHLKFDSNLSREIMISLNRWVQERQCKGLPSELVRDFDVELYRGGKLVGKQQLRDNYLRHRIIDFEPALCDTVKVKCFKTYGDNDIRIFEIRVY